MKLPPNQPRSTNVEDRRSNTKPGMFDQELVRILQATGLDKVILNAKELGRTGVSGWLEAWKKELADREQAKRFEMAQRYYLAKTGVPTNTANLFGMVMQRPHFGPGGPQPRASASFTPEQMFGLDPTQNVWENKVDLGPEYGMLTLEEAKQATNKGPQKRPRRSRKIKR